MSEFQKEYHWDRELCDSESIRSKAQVISSKNDCLWHFMRVEHSPALEPRSDGFYVYKKLGLKLSRPSDICAVNAALKRKEPPG